MLVATIDIPIIYSTNLSLISSQQLLSFVTAIQKRQFRVKSGNGNKFLGNLSSGASQQLLGFVTAMQRTQFRVKSGNSNKFPGNPGNTRKVQYICLQLSIFRNTVVGSFKEFARIYLDMNNA